MTLPTPARTVKRLKCRGCKPLKARSRLKGARSNHCVLSREGKLVRCFRDLRTAKKVARGLGPGFRVGAMTGD